VNKFGENGTKYAMDTMAYLKEATVAMEWNGMARHSDNDHTTCLNMRR